MPNVVRCPACRAQLTLPDIPVGETSQCPRCLHDFDPSLRPSTDASEPDSPEPPRGEWKATLAMALVAGCILTLAFQLYVNDVRTDLITPRQQNDIDLFVGVPDPDFDQRWDRWEDIAGKMVVFSIIVFLLTVIAVLLWLHQASSNLKFLHADGLTHAPAGAVFSFFAPIVNLFRPCAIVQEICKASDPAAVATTVSWQHSPALKCVKFWWISFLAAVILAILALWVGMDQHANLFDDMRLDADNQRMILRLWCASNLALIVAGILLIVVIHRIEQRQRERYTRLTQDES